MKTKSLIILVLIAMQSCVTQTFITQEEGAGIPKKAETINVTVDQDAAAMYKTVLKDLITAGFRIDYENEELLNVTTHDKDVGQSTLLRLHMLVTEIDGKTKITARPEYKPGADAQLMAQSLSGTHAEFGWTPATWKTTGRSRWAFGYTVKFMKKYSTNITYE